MKDEMTNVTLDEIPDIAVGKSSSTSSEHNRHHHRHRHHHSSSISKHKRTKRIKKSTSQSKGKLKFKDFIKQNKKRLLNIFIAVLFVVVLIIVASFRDLIIFKDTDNNTETSNGHISVDDNSSIKIETRVFTKDVSISNQAVIDLFSDENTLNVTELYDKYQECGRLDIGVPVKLYYNVLSMPSGYNVSSSKLTITEKEDITNSRVFNLSSKQRSVDVYNLKSNTEYAYSFELLLNDNNTYTYSGSFKTADTPRLLYIEGAYNVRDIGGYQTIDGREIKQGLLYRGTELDGAGQPKYQITDNGIKEMLITLGVKTNMDLRSPVDSNGLNILGNNVNHICYNSDMYSGVFTSESGKEAIKNIFSDLSKEENYPVYLHCTYGIDRTGTVCYLLEALLGMSEFDCMKEYELSSFHHHTIDHKYIDDFIVHLKNFEGADLKSNAENFLLSIGVSADEISAIRDIFLTK